VSFELYNPSGFALKIFKDRYAIHCEETFAQACERVSRTISDAETGTKRDEYFTRFLDILQTNRFSPGGRIWRGSGRPRGQMLNCFVIPAEDSREGWGDVLRNVTIISGTGGGVGINFSKIRPRGTPIRGTGGEATGSVSLMRAVNAVCNELRDGGARRSALMFCLKYDHPDLMEFLEAKLDNSELTNANISVCIDDTFLKLLDTKEDIVFRWQGEDRGKVPASVVWDKIIQNAWENGDPGLLNIGLMNNQNTISYVAGGEILSTNPCGEVPLESYGCCCLGAINLYTHVVDGEIDWDSLEETIATSVRFLDNVLDQNNYPIPIIEETCQKHRRIGLGVMGLHDMLLELGHKYSSNEALTIIDKVMDFIKKQAYHASISLAIEKGSFHAFDVEQHIKTGFVKKCLGRRHHRLIKEHGIRNCAILTIAPTGTISIVAGCSSGIEPLFQPVYKRSFNEHKDTHDKVSKNRSVEIVVHPLLKQFLADGKSIKHFQGAHDIKPEIHLAMQAVCQKHIDNAISKTINLPEDYDVNKLSKDMRQYIEELKGITIYRDNSKGRSPLIPLPLSEAKQHLDQMEEKAAVNDCPSGACEVVKGGS
jgi:ribonucleoside-diphosphate reductase alpha chain